MPPKRRKGLACSWVAVVAIDPTRSRRRTARARVGRKIGNAQLERICRLAAKGIAAGEPCLAVYARLARRYHVHWRTIEKYVYARYPRPHRTHRLHALPPRR